MLKNIKLLPVLALVLIPAILFAETGPKTQIEETMNAIIEEVEKNSGDANKKVREGNLRTIVDNRFDFEEMAKRSLGKNWKTATEPQQKEFVKTFSELLIRTYIDRLDQAKKGMVNFLDEKVREPKALVKTSIKMNEDTFPIDYKLIKRGDNWEVYDVIIENVGLISNYRSEFSGIVRKEKIAGLLVRLKEKTEKLNNPKSGS